MTLKRLIPRFMIAANWWLLAFASPVFAQPAPALTNDMIEINYSPPQRSGLKPIYEYMKEHHFLEQLKQFLSPLKLQMPLRITMLECGVTNSFWESRSQGLKLCYEWPDWVSRLAPAEQTDTGIPRQDVVVGSFVQVALHELGHGLFDIYDVPLFGREEDAADQIAAFIMTQFGRSTARRLLPGTAFFWGADDRPWSHDWFSDEHGNPQQRAYNFLCIAYGAFKEEFKDVVESGLLPKSRAEVCEHEFFVVRNAFAKTIYPHIDLEKMKIVQSSDWLAGYYPAK
jgi:Putative metallopeptidase